VITANLIGQWGNQAIIYVTAKILADMTGMAYVPRPEFLTKSGSPVTWHQDIPLFVMEPTFGQSMSHRPRLFYGPHWINPGAINSRCPIHLAGGYYQRYEFLRPYKDEIRNEWLRLRKPFVATDPDAVYVHCRRTDYVVERTMCQQRTGSPAANSIEEYAACLREFPDARRLVVTTDNPKDPFMYEFQKLGLPWSISNGTWDQDFLLLASARWVIMSQSTYSWWAAFLGLAERIVCPLATNSVWYRGRNATGADNAVNLIVNDEGDRWKWLEL